GASARQNPALVQIATRRLPNRVTNAPQTGIAVTDPIAAPNSASPSTPSLNRSDVFIPAIRDTHVDTTSPCTRNAIITPQNAASSLARARDSGSATSVLIAPRAP